MLENWSILDTQILPYISNWASGICSFFQEYFGTICEDVSSASLTTYCCSFDRSLDHNALTGPLPDLRALVLLKTM